MNFFSDYIQFQLNFLKHFIIFSEVAEICLHYQQQDEDGVKTMRNVVSPQL